MIVTATEFKAKCLELLDRVKLTGERIQVTKRGKIVAELGPANPAGQHHAKAGCAKEFIKITGDIMAPLDIEWDVLK